MSHLNHKPSKEEQDAQLQKRLDEECDVKLLRREVIVIHNILSTLQYKLGDAKIVLGILDKLTVFAAVDSNIPPEETKKQIALGKKVD